MFTRRFITILATAAALTVTAPTARADIIAFSTDFNSGAPAQFSGITTLQGVAGYNGLGPTGNQFSDQFLRNATGGNPTGTAGSLTTLTLTGLPVHNSIDLNFLLAVIDSWDGFNGDPAPDVFNVRVCSRNPLQASGSSNYTPAPGVLLASGTNRGFGAGGFFNNDGAYNMYLEPAFDNIAHTASTLTIDWFANGAGWQGNLGNPTAFDESWAIDNVQVVLHPGGVAAVPEPGSLLLFACGALGLLGYTSHRRSRA